MFKKLLVITVLCATSIACAGTRIDGTYRGEQATGQFDENKKTTLKFGSVTLEVTAMENTSEGLTVEIIIGANDNERHAVVKEFAPWNQAVTIPCKGEAEESVTLTATVTEEKTTEEQAVVIEEQQNTVTEELAEQS